MKKLFPLIFLFVLWAATDAFADPLRLIVVAGFAAALFCMLLLPGRRVGQAAAAVILAALCVFFPSDTVRLIPVLLLLAAQKQMPRLNAEKKKKKASADLLYTLVLFAVLTAAGVLIYDITYYSRNGFSLIFCPLFWALPGVLILYLFFAVFTVKYGGKTVKPFSVVYVGALLCVMCASAGAFLNLVSYGFTFVVFPWLTLPIAGASTDPMLLAASEELMSALQRFLRKEA